MDASLQQARHFQSQVSLVATQQLINMSDESPVVIVCSGDPGNGDLDQDYAERVCQEFREQTGWLVKRETRIWNELVQFSMRYSKQQRDVSEVVMIFRIAHGLMDVEPTLSDSE